MEEKILFAVDQSVRACMFLKRPESVTFIQRAATKIAEVFLKGNKLIIAGNGGSLCDAAHFAEELTGFFRKKRRALPAIALTDPGHITCTANDLNFASVFSRGVEAYGKKGDLFIGLSTSGQSENIISAFQVAKQMNLHTIAFLGKEGGALKGFADLELLVSGFETSDRIQEAHMAAIHILIEMVEELLFPEEERGRGSAFNEQASLYALE